MADGKDKQAARGTGVFNPHYAAFISYSHAEDEFANWLHKRLEGYQIPRSLLGRNGGSGRAAKRLGRVFRDRVELSAAHDLGAEIRKALEVSDALIVLCSPRSALSQYVGEEIRYFKELGKGKRIFAAILSGEPHAAGKPGRTDADECFPRALVYSLNADHTLSRQPEAVEPIAADFRELKDGRENGSLKLIAGLLGVGLDDLVRREKQAERARRRRTQIVASIMAALALGAAGAGGVAWQQQQVAESRRAEAERQTAEAAHRLSDVISLQAETIFEAGSGDQSASLLMALQADPAAGRSAISQRYDGGAGYPWARAILVSTLLADRSQAILKATSIVNAVAFSSDGKRILTGSSKTLQVWDAESAELLLTLAGHTGLVTSVASSPDNKRYITGSEDNTARIWDSETGRPLFTLQSTSMVISVAFSPDGKLILTGLSDKTARIWDAETGKPLLTLQDTNDVSEVAFSDDGKRIFTGSVSAARIWDAETGKPLFQLDDGRTSHGVSPDGKRILAGEGTTAQVWDTESGRALFTLEGHTHYITQAAFSRDGKRILTGSMDKTARVWDAKTGKPLVTFGGHDYAVLSVAFSGDGKRILTGSGDKTARVWDAESRKPLLTLLDDRNPSPAVFSPDGKRIVMGLFPRVLDAETGRSLFTLGDGTQSVRSVAYSPDGKRIAGGNRSLRVWDAEMGKLLLEFEGDTKLIESMAFSPDGKRILTREVIESAPLTHV